MKHIVLFLCVLFVSLGAKAQYYYSFSSGSNPKGLNTEVEYPEGGGQPAGWTKIYTGPATSPAWSSNAAIPFPFQFNGSSETDLKVSSSGVLTFDITTVNVPAEANASLPSASIPDKSVCIWGLKSAVAGDNIYTKTFGTAPNRQFWIQFNSFSEAGLGTGYTYWSIVLEETTNKIYLVDQRSSSTSTTLTAGIQVNSTTAFQVTGSPSLALKSAADPNPIDNYYYEFIPGIRPAYDLSVTKMNVLKDLGLVQAPFQIKGTLFNGGATTITSVTMNYTVNGGPAVSATINGLSIATNTSYNFTHPTVWNPGVVGTYTIEAFATNLNTSNADLVPANDKSSASTTVWENCTERRALHEIFTSSTCPPCKPGNEIMHSVLNQKLGKFAVIKYQYYFPGNGDPYFTLESYNRGTYYGGVNSIPCLFIDGGWNSNPNSGYNAATFDQFQTKPSFVEITPSMTLSGKTVNVSADIKPLIDMAPGSYKVRIAVVEKMTELNVKTNLETEFFYVMKKMLPNEAGASFTFPAKDQTSTVTQSYTFPGSYKLTTNARINSSTVPTGSNYNGINIATENSVEDFFNLAVVVFIQNETTKEIVQASWTAKDWVASAQQPKSNVPSFSLYPNPATNQFQIGMNMLMEKDLEVTVVDLSGKTIMNKTFRAELNEDLTVDCSAFAKGAYFIQMNYGGNTSVKKLMIR